MKIIHDVYYSKIKDENHLIDLYLPDGKSDAVLVFFHGGGIESGSRDLSFMTRFAEDMTDAGIAIASVEYRMYPEAKYPEFIEDAAEAVAYSALELQPRLGCDRLFVGGTSAGGYLSLMLCFNSDYLARHGVSNANVTGYIHDAGQPTSHFNVLKERGYDTRRVVIDESAPLYHVGRQDDYPPMQIIVSDNDMPGRPEQTELLVSTLLQFGYDMKKLDYAKTHGKHTWYVNQTDENNKNEFAKIILPFINKHL